MHTRGGHSSERTWESGKSQGIKEVSGKSGNFLTCQEKLLVVRIEKKVHFIIMPNLKKASRK